MAGPLGIVLLKSDCSSVTSRSGGFDFFQDIPLQHPANYFGRMRVIAADSIGYLSNRQLRILPVKTVGAPQNNHENFPLSAGRIERT